MPRITNSIRCPAHTSSVRMPASLRPPTRTSLGHLSSGVAPVSATVSARATAAVRVSGGIRRGSSVGRSTAEKYRLSPGGECQLRPSRPRPRVWASAITTAPWGARPCPASSPRAQEAATSLVEPHSASAIETSPSQPEAISGPPGSMVARCGPVGPVGPGDPVETSGNSSSDSPAPRARRRPRAAGAPAGNAGRDRRT